MSIRPHCKAHKCAEIAKLQMELLGATGVCCQKVTGQRGLTLANSLRTVPSSLLLSFYPYPLKDYPMSMSDSSQLAEVEAMVEGGVTDILLSNELVSPPKISRLAAMAAGGAKLSLCVDDLGNVAAVSETAARAGAEIELLVDCNVGQVGAALDSLALADP